MPLGPLPYRYVILGNGVDGNGATVSLMDNAVGLLETF